MNRILKHIKEYILLYLYIIPLSFTFYGAYLLYTVGPYSAGPYVMIGLLLTSIYSIFINLLWSRQ